MAENQTNPQVQACRLRVARLTAAGAPLTGADSQYVSDALVSVAFAPVYTDGQEIKQQNGCGENYVNYKAPDQFDRGTLTIRLLTPDPELAEMLSYGTVIEDGSTERKGFAAPAIGATPSDAVSVEAWVKRINNGVLDADSPYAWHVYPWFTNMRIGSHTLENGAQIPEYTGQVYENENWDTGPGFDFPAPATRVHQWFPTDSMPDATNAYAAVTAP